MMDLFRLLENWLGVGMRADFTMWFESINLHRITFIELHKICNDQKAVNLERLDWMYEYSYSIEIKIRRKKKHTRKIGEQTNNPTKLMQIHLDRSEQR